MIENILHTLAVGIASIGMVISSWFGITTTPLGATVPTAVALFETSLASAITSSDTAMTLTSATDKAGTSFASSTYAFVIDGGTSAEEMVVADCTATACTAMTRGLSPVTGNTSVASLKFAHRRGASVKITDGPQLLILSRIVNGQETIPNKLSYTSAPTFSNGNELITKTYVDGVAIAGGVDSSTSTKGISKLSVAPVSAASPIVVGQNDPQFVNYFEDTGAANAYVLTPSPAVAAYADGQRYSFRASAANTTTATLNVNGLGAKTIKKQDGTANLDAGDIATGQNVAVQYEDSTQTFRMMSPIGATPFPSKFLFGDGSDGDVVISGNSSITRDMYYHDLTINDTITLSVNGFKVFVSGTLTQVGTGKFITNGAAGTLPAAIAGVAGASTSASANPPIVSNGLTGNSSTASATNATPSAAGAAGNGGTAANTTGWSGPAGTGGSGGSIVSSNMLFNYQSGIYRNFATFVGGYIKHMDFHAGNGSGGAGASCNSSSSSCTGGIGGASGANGGPIAIFANAIVTANNPLASSTGTAGTNGAAGNNGSNGGGGGGGGGGNGGNGGWVYVAYKTLTGSLTATLTGGALGTGGAAGTGPTWPGSAGTNGVAGIAGILVTVAI